MEEKGKRAKRMDREGGRKEERKYGKGIRRGRGDRRRKVGKGEDEIMIGTKELILCQKLKFFNPYIYATW